MRDSVFFFFKQKTAYERRISDWSSDVCSSDLGSGLSLSQPSLGPKVLKHGMQPDIPIGPALGGRQGTGDGFGPSIQVAEHGAATRGLLQQPSSPVFEEHMRAADIHRDELELGKSGATLSEAVSWKSELSNMETLLILRNCS